MESGASYSLETGSEGIFGDCSTFGYDIQCEDGEIQISAGGGDWDNEISWRLDTCDGTEIDSGMAGAFCVELSGSYYVTLIDSFGDGWNGASFTIDGESYQIEDGTE